MTLMVCEYLENMKTTIEENENLMKSSKSSAKTKIV
jgi:hypothetical protein